MVEITLSRNEIIKHLVSLLRVLAEAIQWVSQRNRKVTFVVPDDCAKEKAGGSCLSGVSPSGRIDAEILIGILKKKGKKGH